MYDPPPGGQLYNSSYKYTILYAMVHPGRDGDFDIPFAPEIDSVHPYLETLLKCIALEEKEQALRYRLDQAHSLKNLKAEGLALHPITVTRKTFGFAEYPEIGFRLRFPNETGLFRDGAAIECFLTGQEPVKGILLSLDGKTGEFRLFAPDYPDWIEEEGVGIKLSPDTRTTEIMKKVLNEIPGHKTQQRRFEEIHGAPAPTGDPLRNEDTRYFNPRLNDSQKNAVRAVIQNEGLLAIHGPPGTGKTTTLIEAIRQLVDRGQKVLVCAPSNTAVDHIAKGLIREGTRLLRVGNSSRADELIFPHTPEGRMLNSREQKEIKNLRIRAEEFRRMALKYKRSFGKAEREQRNLLFQEVKNIRREIQRLSQYHEEKLFAGSDVIAGTPIGLYDDVAGRLSFDSLVIDEAGQCIEPLAWCVFPLAEKIILAGDHWQLPPTVLSEEAASLGLNRSILESVVAATGNVYLLNTQYRMRQSIAGFSAGYFYNGLLKTATHLHDTGVHLTFIDTAGSGFNETHGPDGVSLQNEGELRVALQLLENEKLSPAHTALISPYAGQVLVAKDLIPAAVRASTVDSFQGQEKENVIVSLVRSNEEGEIGFLKDYRRMNVAITRAKERLFVIGDSATIGSDPFYSAFLSYVEKTGTYGSVWEFEM